MLFRSRRDVAGGLVDDHAGSGHEGKLVGVDDAEFRRAAELHAAAVDTGAHYQVIVAAEYFLGDRAIYVKALKANLLVYSRTGIITRQGMNSALKMMATFDPDLKDKKIDLRKTFDDRFIKRAAVLFDDPTNSDLEMDDRRPEIDLTTFRD